MRPYSIPPRLPLLVFTDLDGSLLDHDDYSFTAARPALAQLQRAGIPLIPATSKTLAEMLPLAAQLQTRHPLIVENGSLVCLPDGYFCDIAGLPLEAGYRLLRLVPEYALLLEELRQLRAAYGFRFRGFHDMDTAEIARDTGLDPAAAQRARRRLCSEPLLWQDGSAAFERFEAALAARSLRLVRGGRYWHVLWSPADKGRALQRLVALYRQCGLSDFITLALGDSPNDCSMLQAADRAVIVRRQDGGVLDCVTGAHVITTAAAGPAGWNAALLQVLQSLHTSSGASQPGSPDAA